MSAVVVIKSWLRQCLYFLILRLAEDSITPHSQHTGARIEQLKHSLNYTFYTLMEGIISPDLLEGCYKSTTLCCWQAIVLSPFVFDKIHYSFVLYVAERQLLLHILF